MVKNSTALKLHWDKMKVCNYAFTLNGSCKMSYHRMYVLITGGEVNHLNNYKVLVACM